MTGRVLCQAASCQPKLNKERGKGARRAGDGCFVCVVCSDRLKGDLRNLPALYDDCMIRTDPSPTPSRVIRNGPRKSAAADLLSPAATETRAAIRTVLASWASLVADERRLKPPARNIRALARFLSLHAEWLAGHPAAGEAVDEIGDLTRSARKIAYPNGAGRVRVGDCPACNGELVVLMRHRDDPLPSEIVCTTAPDHTWPATRWATLARRMRDNQRGGQCP